MAFNENTRVKIPAILHFVRLGYEYISLKNVVRDEQTNIFTEIFTNSISKINTGIEPDEVKRLLQEVSLLLDNEDLGLAFYQKLTAKSGTRLIDFENFDNNTFNVVTELTYKNGDEEFRPDIILLINGMPLAFVEVKKPNNKEGVLAERDRINTRFQNKKFRKFVNITQLMVFSNNMKYDDTEIEPIQGAFYATTSYFKPIFNYFREEQNLDLASLLLPEDDDLENFVLKDNNLIAIKYSPEFVTNKDPNNPTNSIATSLFSKDRFKFILRYAIAYVKEEKGLEKHIMRYPQIFATKAIAGSKLPAKVDSLHGSKPGLVSGTSRSAKEPLVSSRRASAGSFARATSIGATRAAWRSWNSKS